MEPSRLPRFGIVLLVLVALGWGFSWPAIKLVLVELPPLTYRTLCLVVGGGGILALARLGGQSLFVPRRYWGQLVALSATSVVGWNIFVVYGVANLPGGRAALLAYTMPVWSALLSIWLLGERLTLRRVVSLLLGMGGVVALLGTDLAEIARSAGGVALMLSAAMSWAMGIVLLKRFAVPIPTAALTGWTMFGGGVPIAVIAVILEHGRWHSLSVMAGASLAYSIIVAFMFCYWAWNRVVLMVPVAVSSVSSLATPIVGVLSSVWLLDEKLTWHEATAAAFILAAIALVYYPRARPRAAKVQ